MTGATLKRRRRDGTIATIPTIRKVQSVGKTWRDEFIMEAQDDCLLLRPKGARRHGPAAHVIPWGTLYQHLNELRLQEKSRERARRRKARKFGRGRP